MSKDWSHLFERMPELLAPTMAKDHPNLPVVKEEGCYYYGLMVKNISILLLNRYDKCRTQTSESSKSN